MESFQIIRILRIIILPISGVFLSLNLAVFAQIPSDANLQVRISTLSETNISGIISNTQPDIQYEIQLKQGRTNWMSAGSVFGSELTNWTAFHFRNINAINSKTVLRVRSWQDDGSGLPIWWQLKYFGNVGVDPYGNPADDGWNNLEKFQFGMDPLKWYQPPKPVFDIKFHSGASNVSRGDAILTWQCRVGTIPDCFLVERANRRFRLMTNALSGHPGPYGFNNRYGRPGSRHEDPFVTGPFEIVARIPGKPNVRDYNYVETNVDTFLQPLYRVSTHYSPPLHASLDRIDAKTIRGTMLRVTAVPTTNGYNLTVPHPIPYARY
ncbi:MAG TPA: hypothetical protein VKQ08_01980, partial [Cyclobacteriaceae bacterium]|nr:hypothetical protein [Cyclobacteriaceae bacterium]